MVCLGLNIVFNVKAMPLTNSPSRKERATLSSVAICGLYLV